MMDELLAFSRELPFSLWLLRTPASGYLHDLEILKERGVDVRVRPFRFSLSAGRIRVAALFILTNFVKLVSGYSAVIGWKSIFWFLRLDDRLINGKLNIHAQFATQAALVAFLIRQHSKQKSIYYFTFHAYDIYFNNKWLSKLVNNSELAFSISEYNKTYVGLKFKALEESKIRLSRLGAQAAEPADMLPGKKKFIIGFMGRLVEKKGLVYLLEAMELLSDIKNEIQLLIAGDGPLRVSLSKFINTAGLDNVSLLGEISDGKKGEFYNSLDVFVMPSVVLNKDMDGIPVVMMEAVAHGLPLIASNVSGLPEICIHNVNGLLVQQRDAKALAESIRLLASDLGYCKKLGSAANEVFRKYNLQENSHHKLQAMIWLN